MSERSHIWESHEVADRMAQSRMDCLKSLRSPEKRSELRRLVLSCNQWQRIESMQCRVSCWQCERRTNRNEEEWRTWWRLECGQWIACSSLACRRQLLEGRRIRIWLLACSRLEGGWDHLQGINYEARIGSPRGFGRLLSVFKKNFGYNKRKICLTIKLTLKWSEFVTNFDMNVLHMSRCKKKF